MTDRKMDEQPASRCSGKLWWFSMCLTESSKNIRSSFPPVPFLSFNPHKVSPLRLSWFTVNISMYHCHIRTFIYHRGLASPQCTIHPHSHIHTERIHTRMHESTHKSVCVYGYAHGAQVLQSNCASACVLLILFLGSIYHPGTKNVMRTHTRCTQTYTWAVSRLYHSAMRLTISNYSLIHVICWEAW